MKVSTSAFFSALCSSAHLASATTANFYTYDPQSPPRPQPRTLSPVAARLVLAQRAGVEDFHSADLNQEDVITAINDYGIRTPLFAGKQTYNHAVILLEDDHFVPSLDIEPYTSFSVSPIPSTKATEGLFIDLAKQSLPKTFSSLSDKETVAYIKENHSKLGDNFFLAQSGHEFESLIHQFVESNNWHMTALTIPSKAASNDNEKASWGTYFMPNQQATLQRRQQRAPEEILTDAHEFQPVQSITPLASNNTYNNNNNNTTTPLRGILPACFTTQSHCEKATRNCTGHGSCSKKYRDPDSGSGGIDCYSCSCKPTILENSNGKKTTTWGGPACQKKDVSIEFWLIALFTVALMFLVSFAVGSVWEMGSEELPSVIGAGVSGPTARK